MVTRVPTKGKQDDQSQGRYNDRSRVMCFQDGGGSPEPRDVGVFQKLEKGKRSTHTAPRPGLPWGLQKALNPLTPPGLQI